MFSRYRIVLMVAVAVTLFVAAIGCGESVEPTEDSQNRREAMVDRHYVNRAIEVKNKYREMLWRQPNIYGLGVGLFDDGTGGYTGEVGIKVRVTKLVDQQDLPVEDRIPPFLDGIPVQIIEAPNTGELIPVN